MNSSGSNPIDYRALKLFYLTQIDQGLCKCILSGLIIKNAKDLSLEHYVPLCRGAKCNTQTIANIYPAIKVINNIKDDLLPCEWVIRREARMERALNRWKLTDADRKTVEEALKKAPTYNLNVCNYCINYDKCH